MKLVKTILMIALVATTTNSKNTKPEKTRKTKDYLKEFAKNPEQLKNIINAAEEVGENLLEKMKDLELLKQKNRREIMNLKFKIQRMKNKKASTAKTVAICFSILGVSLGFGVPSIIFYWMGPALK